MKRTIILLACAATLVACSQAPTTSNNIPHPPSPLQQHYNRYLLQEPYKAYALAIDDQGDIASGYGYHAKTQIKANQRALAECRKQLKYHQVDTDCELYAIGNSKISDKELP